MACSSSRAPSARGRGAHHECPSSTEAEYASTSLPGLARRKCSRTRSWRRRESRLGYRRASALGRRTRADSRRLVGQCWRGNYRRDSVCPGCERNARLGKGGSASRHLRSMDPSAGPPQCLTHQGWILEHRDFRLRHRRLQTPAALGVPARIIDDLDVGYTYSCARPPKPKVPCLTSPVSGIVRAKTRPRRCVLSLDGTPEPASVYLRRIRAIKWRTYGRRQATARSRATQPCTPHSLCGSAHVQSSHRDLLWPSFCRELRLGRASEGVRGGFRRELLISKTGLGRVS